MAELRTEQERQKEQQQAALDSLEQKYQKQIDSLQTHLQRLVAESQSKEEQLQQVRS